MPNQCTCYVDIYSDDDCITKALIDKIYSMPHDVDFFSSLITLPDGVKIVDVKRRDVDTDWNGEEDVEYDETTFMPKNFLSTIFLKKAN
jgi:hypothetical protein